ncbi:IS6 family transposase [Meridianimarinicoccus aquatilis]|uniref:IS6 family transposase n=1 Tax=Meridianimarinicoccus aquatilis TaxID=2552766 RepID=A0A4R6AJ40_9RHOB|nr:IS6 family transposase [Fluviibacterium aquatile]
MQQAVFNVITQTWHWFPVRQRHRNRGKRPSLRSATHPTASRPKSSRTRSGCASVSIRACVRSKRWCRSAASTFSTRKIQRWTLTFWPPIARTLRRRHSRPGDVSYLDEAVVRKADRSFWLWRAVDQDGVVLDDILHSRRDTCAAKRRLLRLVKRYGVVPERIITDTLRPYGAAKHGLAPGGSNLF